MTGPGKHLPRHLYPLPVPRPVGPVEGAPRRWRLWDAHALDLARFPAPCAAEDPDGRPICDRPPTFRAALPPMHPDDPPLALLVCDAHRRALTAPGGPALLALTPYAPRSTP